MALDSTANAVQQERTFVQEGKDERDIRLTPQKSHVQITHHPFCTHKHCMRAASAVMHDSYVQTSP